jgi:outer membrane protein, multidrug efflux system
MMSMNVSRWLSRGSEDACSSAGMCDSASACDSRDACSSAGMCDSASACDSRDACSSAGTCTSASACGPGSERSSVLATGLLAFTISLVAGCAVGPRYKQPEIRAPERYANAPADLAMSDATVSQWWLQFHDAKLQDLISRALESNLDLQGAAARIRQARAQEIIAGAALLPSVNATSVGAHLHSNSNPLSPAANPTDTKLFAAGFDATWELDLFGRTRRSVESARAGTDAAVWQLRDAEVSLSAEVAVDYLTLCTAQARMHIVRTAIERQQNLLEIAEGRRKAGFVTELDVNRQRAQLGATLAQLPPLEAQARAATHALAVLLGQQPEAMYTELESSAALPAAPPVLPVGLPSDLLRRRPDVRQAERTLAAATAQIGVAVASLYPTFDLIGAANYASDSLGNLLSSDNFARVAVGLMRWPVFQGGRARANVDAREAERDQAYLAYQQSVLRALQDTEDSLVRYTAAQRQIHALEDSEKAGQSSLDIARAQYKAGVVPFIDVLTAETTLLDTQDQLAQTRMAVEQNFVSVYKALGGGWDP